MPILAAHKLSKEFADRVLFSDVNFSFEKGDKVGFIGASGAGKTTLFKIILGHESASGGEIVTSSGIKIGYLEQHVCGDSDRTAFEETLLVFSDLIEMEKRLEEINTKLLTSSDSKLIEEQLKLSEAFQNAGGLTYLSRTNAVLLGLGFSPLEIRLPVSALSGGQRSKIGLAKLLLCNNDLILLDEPTNHLDINSISFLEEYIKSFSGSAIIISHDRFFLNQICNKTLELENQKIYSCDGNFARYEKLKQERLLSEKREYDNKIKEIERIEGIIEQQRRWNREKNIKTAESKQKQIDRIEKTLVRPENESHKILIDFPVAVKSGNRVLSVLNEQCRFEDKVLYEKVNFEILRGERVCLIGPNGVGKSTLIKRLISKKYEEFVFGTSVTVGYFDQFQDNLNPKSTPKDEIHSAYPNLTDTAVRNALAAFEFKGDDVFKLNASLSGGEKARVSMCKLVLSGKNFLVLDEPTNHLDLYSRKALEDALLSYDGTLLIVSHDRYFINKIATKILFLDNDGVTTISGNYDDYLKFAEKKGQEEIIEIKEVKEQKGKDAYLSNKKRQSDIRKLETLVQKTEKEISRLEEKNEEIKALINEAGSDFEKLTELTELLNENEKALTEQFEIWEEKSMLLSSME